MIYFAKVFYASQKNTKKLKPKKQHENKQTNKKPSPIKINISTRTENIQIDVMQKCNFVFKIGLQNSKRFTDAFNLSKESLKHAFRLLCCFISFLCKAPRSDEPNIELFYSHTVAACKKPTHVFKYNEKTTIISVLFLILYWLHVYLCI